ncbi:MAG: hypothetical protein MK434_10350 [SAR324 cluster bacterium]|uniref:Uncharacterized protein n=1 Tax=marine metagenome TaxID=408172 RepID=A0A381XNI0_9ZZZZ|nr:hypothetical protein [SAR324 cluster bacterium]|tara:strand:+ start:817 stop:1068 length:252 start_codon:yes stop_codon:yes gene_type:complete
MALFTQGCSNLQEKVYTRIPDNVYQQAEKVCNNIDGSQFIVRDLRVWMKKKDDSEIELKHYKSILPDGYYFCSGHDRNSLIIE